MRAMASDTGLVPTLLDLPIFEAEWVLWLLLALSLVSVVVMLERIWFFHAHRANTKDLRLEAPWRPRTRCDRCAGA